ncbi:MAG: hypothetical protein FLDDKLPJ_03762 [Phycisphaerae bacterium]|nr:hypothetical protein [Phycisphaerae bacterium]
MLMATSVNGAPVRLTFERWTHIIEAHDELAGYMQDVLEAVEQPDRVTQGYKGSLVAWKGYGKRKYLAVVYKELSRTDGCIITAFFTTKARRRNTIWP